MKPLLRGPTNFNQNFWDKHRSIVIWGFRSPDIHRSKEKNKVVNILKEIERVYLVKFKSYNPYLKRTTKRLIYQIAPCPLQSQGDAEWLLRVASENPDRGCLPLRKYDYLLQLYVRRFYLSDGRRADDYRPQYALDYKSRKAFRDPMWR